MSRCVDTTRSLDLVRVPVRQRSTDVCILVVDLLYVHIFVCIIRKTYYIAARILHPTALQDLLQRAFGRTS